CPSPVARGSGTPLTVNVAVALPMTWPAVADVKVTWNWPLALVVPERGVDGTALAPLVLVRVTVTLAPAAGDEPPLMILLTVTVKVWGAPTAFTSSGAMLMLASTTVTVATFDGA